MDIDLTINSDLARKILCGFIKSEITRVGFSRAVIGLSGGIDSALSCYLTVEALGPENVLVVRMPYKTSAQESWDHAGLCIADLGVQTLDIPITEMADALIGHFPDMSKVRKGNIMARIRMITLYDQSEAFGGLVVGTSNKTEILLGYSTIFGDAACALNPIGDLYKTQVRQLSREIGVPSEIVEKAPSADLWAGQTDEAELGFTYEEADHLLYLLVDERYRPKDLIAAGFDEKFVRQVVGRVRHNQFKRVLPPIAKLTNRTVGYDFLYLRDWGT
jgi:NAD+ synthase